MTTRPIDPAGDPADQPAGDVAGEADVHRAVLADLTRRRDATRNDRRPAGR